MQDLGKIIRLHLFILLGYALLIVLISYLSAPNGTGYDAPSFYYLFLMMYAIGLHVLILLIIMIVKFAKGQKELGLSHLVSLFVVGIIGFSSCLGGGALLDAF